jgi:hypothetical protein
MTDLKKCGVLQQKRYYFLYKTVSFLREKTFETKTCPIPERNSCYFDIYIYICIYTYISILFSCHELYAFLCCAKNISARESAVFFPHGESGGGGERVGGEQFFFKRMRMYSERIPVHLQI